MKNPCSVNITVVNFYNFVCTRLYAFLNSAFNRFPLSCLFVFYFIYVVYFNIDGIEKTEFTTCYPNTFYFCPDNKTYVNILINIIPNGLQRYRFWNVVHNLQTTMIKKLLYTMIYVSIEIIVYYEKCDYKLRKKSIAIHHIF